MSLAEKLKSVIYKYSADFRKKSSEITDLTYDIIENSMLYRVNGMEGKNREKYCDELQDLQIKATKANILENSMQPIYNSIAMMGVVIVIYLGWSKVIEGAWTVGVFSTYIAMFTAMGVKESKAAKLFNSVQKSQVSWKRIKPYLNEYEKKDTTKNIREQGTMLKVEKLSFGYDEEKEYIVKEISFEGRAGEIIGITGPIASGKSTLISALLGLYPYSGSIKIDGKELREYSEYERSCMIAYLGHNPQLISDSIYNNITLGEDKTITDVLRDVCFNKDLSLMIHGEDTLVGNSGIRLSGGQQARIALARALLNKSKIIILDDPFSAVDMKTEDDIIDNLKNNYKDSLIKSSAMKVFRNNAITTITLAFAIVAVVIASLIPPQILKYIIDYNLVPKNSHKLLIMAMSYICVLIFVGVFDFVKEALITILGQKITKKIRIEMMEKLERLNMSFFFMTLYFHQ